MSDLSAPDITIDSDGNFKFNPKVCSTYIAWKEDSTGFGSFDIILYNILSGNREIIAGPSDPGNPAVIAADQDYAPVVITRDSRIIWVDERNGNKDIYMFSYGPVTTCPVVQFSADKTQGSAPLAVHFTDTSLHSPTLWRWDFGDGNFASGSSVDHTFTTNGAYRVHLTAATPYCRNTTPESMVTTISVGIPVVDFSANVTEGLAPLPVAFTGTGTNTPSAWAWTFGDGGTSAARNPVHTYTAPGKYPVVLTATNAIGTGSKTRTDYIAALNGIAESSRMDIPGIIVTGSGAGQQLDFGKAVQPAYILSADKKTLTLQPPAGYGWKSIIFSSGDAGGFAESAGNITGTAGAIHFQIRDINPTMFPAAVGNNLVIGHQYDTDQWNAGTVLKTQLWEGESPGNEPSFRSIIRNSGYADKNVAYTMTILRDGIANPSSATLNFSVASAWVTGAGDIASERARIYVIAEGYTTTGDHTGTVLPATFIRNDTTGHIEYFFADVPARYAFMNTFALAKLSGSGNPFQLITLTIASQESAPGTSPPPGNSGTGSTGTNGGSDDSGRGSGGSRGSTVQQVQNPNVPGQKAPPVFIDPGKTAPLYASANGVLTQDASLKSTDNLAAITMKEGTIAKDITGNPLPSISIASLSGDDIPASPGGQAVMINGRAYELGPDGATFSPGITLTFTIPQAQWGRQYSLLMYDRASGTWQDIPGSFDSRSGTFTAIVSHFCCFALFEKEIAPSPAPATPKTPAPAPTQAAPPAPAVTHPPQNALSVLFNMAGWVAERASQNSTFLTAITVICVIVLSIMLLYRRRDGS